MYSPEELKESRLKSFLYLFSSRGDIIDNPPYNFDKAVMPGVCFSGLHLSKSSFRHVAGERTLFNDAELDGVYFDYAHLVGASFQNAKLMIAHFCYANLVRADFSGASLHGADFRHADLSSANFYKAHIASARLTYTQMSSVKNLLCIYPLAKQQSCLYAVNHGSYSEGIKVYQEGCFWGSLEEYAELVKNNCESAISPENMRHNRALKNAIKYIRQYGKLYW
jgi:uncharacterized protein YjbI with pentapeptide repeats